VTLLRLRRLDALAAVLETGATRPVFLAHVAATLVLGREALSAPSWRARGVDVERGVAVALGAREPDGRWPAGLACAAVDPPALLRWLAAEGLAGILVDGVVRAGVPAASAAARDGLLGPAAENVLADLEAPLRRGRLSASLGADGVLVAHADLPERPPLDALGGTLGVATVKGSRVAGIEPRDHVLVARGILLDGAPVLTASRDVVPDPPAGDPKKLAAVLAAVPWPAPWHAHPLRRVLRTGDE
jgi:hypothetical protein